MTTHRLPRFSAGALCALGAWALSLVLILAMTWPWAAHFCGSFIDHWDPPFHAWKLEFMARRILAGDLFIHAHNTNMLYPHTGALYFEAIQWPQALFAAPFFALTSLPSECIYHITLLFFWTLTAPAVYFLLRTLRCSRLASFLFAVAACILPHRLSYMVEFQMESICAIPLFYAFFIRFFRRPAIAPALGAVFAWWFQAVTELYQAVFLAMTVPFLVVAFLVARPGVLKDRKFWISAGVAGVVGVLSLYPLLTPYLAQFSAGSVVRRISEVSFHSAQPFSYLLPRPFSRFCIWHPPAAADELSLYPTALLLLFAAGWVVRTLVLRLRAFREHPVSASALLGEFLPAFLFFGCCCLLGFRLCKGGSGMDAMLGVWLPWIACITAFVAVFLPARDDADSAIFFRGLYAAAVLCFFLSLGPQLLIGENPFKLHSLLLRAPNHIYRFLYANVTFLQGFRVVSRFGVIVLCFVLLLAARGADSFVAFLRRRLPGRAAAVAVPAVAVLFIACTAIEAVPNVGMFRNYRRLRGDDAAAISSDGPYCLRRVSAREDYPAIMRLAEKPGSTVLAFFPMGPRHEENMRMFSLLRGDLLYVYAWGGFFPEWSASVAQAAGHDDYETAVSELSKLYPPVTLVLDRDFPFYSRKEVGESDVLFPYVNPADKRIDIGALLKNYAKEVDSDQRFTVYKPLPSAPATMVEKLIRSDVIRENPHVSVSLVGAANDTIGIQLNGVELAPLVLSESGHLDGEFELPVDGLSVAAPNVLRFASGAEEPFVVPDFSLGPKE